MFEDRALCVAHAVASKHGEHQLHASLEPLQLCAAPLQSRRHLVQPSAHVVHPSVCLLYEGLPTLWCRRFFVYLPADFRHDAVWVL